MLGALSQCVAMHQVHSVMYLCACVGQLDYIHLSAPFVAVKNKEVNLTAVLWPSQVGTVTYIWWIGNNTEVLLLLLLIHPRNAFT